MKNFDNYSKKYKFKLVSQFVLINLFIKTPFSILISHIHLLIIDKLHLLFHMHLASKCQFELKRLLHQNTSSKWF